MDCVDGLRWNGSCDGLCRWIAMEWLAEHTPIQTPLHIDAPHPNHTMRAIQLYRCARSKRRRTLKAALRAHYGATRSNGAAAALAACAVTLAACALTLAASARRRRRLLRSSLLLILQRTCCVCYAQVCSLYAPLLENALRSSSLIPATALRSSSLLLATALCALIVP